MQSHVQEKQQTLRLLYASGLDSEFVPWGGGQQGQQTYLKLRREDEVAFLYGGMGGVLAAELQKTMMRLVNDGWSVEGEVNVTFDGTVDPEADAPFAPDACLLEIGSALLPLVDPYQNAPLLGKFPTLRQEIALDIGFVAPGFKVADNMTLVPTAYRIRLRGTLVASGEVFLDRYLALGSLEQLGAFPGWSTTDPSYRLPAKWIEPEQRDAAEGAGCLVLGGLGVLLTHIREVIKANAPLLLGLQETHSLVARLQSSHPIVVEEFLQRIDRLRKVRRVLQRLLAESVSIRDLITILEEIGDHLELLDDAALDERGEAAMQRLTEAIRAALARQITSTYADDTGTVRAMVLSDAAEEHLLKELHDSKKTARPWQENGSDPMVRGVREALEEYQQPAVLFTPPELRVMVRRRLERSFPTLAVLSTAEIAPSLRVEIAGQVKWPQASKRSDTAVAFKPTTESAAPKKEEPAPKKEETASGFWKAGKKKK